MYPEHVFYVFDSDLEVKYSAAEPTELYDLVGRCCYGASAIFHGAKRIVYAFFLAV